MKATRSVRPRCGSPRPGPGAGLRGADIICAEIAERSMPGASAKQWRAFLSAAFPTQMTLWTPSATASRFAEVHSATLALPFTRGGVDVVTSATPLGLMKFEQQATPLGPLAAEPPGRLQAIDTVNPVKVLGDRSCFIGLQVADEVPGDVQGGRLLELSQRLLHDVLAEIALSGSSGLEELFERLSLAHGKEAHSVGGTPGFDGARS